MLTHVVHGIKKNKISFGNVQQLVSLRYCSSEIHPFHLAIPVSNLKAAKEFYGGVLALPEGRSSSKWQDYNLFGHQLVVHEVSTLSDCSLQQVGLYYIVSLKSTIFILIFFLRRRTSSCSSFWCLFK